MGACREVTREWILSQHNLRMQTATDSSMCAPGRQGFYPGAAGDLAPLFLTTVREWIFCDVYPLHTSETGFPNRHGMKNPGSVVLDFLLEHIGWCEDVGLFTLTKVERGMFPHLQKVLFGNPL